jgi:hypothetical protein
MLNILHHFSKSIEFLVTTDALLYFTLSRWNSTGRPISPAHGPLPDNTQYWQDIHAPGSIRNHNPNNRAAADRAVTEIGFFYQCSCHKLLPMYQTSIPVSNLLQDRKLQLVLACFQYGVLLSQQCYIPFNMIRYFRDIAYCILTWHFILANMFIFSSIWRTILANIFSCNLKRRFILVTIFVFQSTRYAIFDNTSCIIQIWRATFKICFFFIKSYCTIFKIIVLSANDYNDNINPSSFTVTWQVSGYTGYTPQSEEEQTHHVLLKH